MDLVTAFVNDDVFKTLPLSADRIKVLTSKTNLPGWQTLKSCQAFIAKTAFLKQYDKIIFSGSNAPLAVVNSTAACNVYYCHTPPRFVYDLQDYYLEQLPLWKKLLLKRLIEYLQPRYEDAIGQMDVVYANSQNVQQRLQKYLGITAEVV